MRIDKFLKVSRIIKRRTIAQQLINSSCVFINDKIIKNSYEVKVNDIITINSHNNTKKYKILIIKDQASVKDCINMYEEVYEN